MRVKLLSIDDIGLSNRVRNALHREKIHLVGEMLECTEESLMQMKNLGIKSVEEILTKIEEYKNLEITEDVVDDENSSGSFIVPENFEEWLENEKNRELVTAYLKRKELKIDCLELLTAKAYNLLLLSGKEYLHEIVFIEMEQLLEIPRMDLLSAEEIAKRCIRYLKEIREEIFASIIEKQAKEIEQPTVSVSIDDMIGIPEYRKKILQYVKTNDMEIIQLALSNRPKNQLIKNGFLKLSDIIFMTKKELKDLPAMGMSSVDEIMEKLSNYFKKHEKRILSVINGDETALWDDEAVRNRILELFGNIGFSGLGLQAIIEKLEFPESVTETRIKKIIGGLLEENYLEYVDYRCYRVYPKFLDAVETYAGIGERNRNLLRKRLQGMTLEAIASEYGLTRERVRQIVKKEADKIRNIHMSEHGTLLFDEDYFRYFYENYEFDRAAGDEWFGITPAVWQYLELMDAKQGSKHLEEALEDNQNLEAGLRLKVKNYLNRNKIYVDDCWIEKRRADIEEYVVRKFCVEDKTFDEFAGIYNKFLKSEEIPYDEDIYYTESVLRTRKNRLGEAKFLLWKMNEQIRYYDIEGRDFTELLDVLNLDAYENIELSAEKFMMDYPEIMVKYDIRDRYELHNLLRKIIPEGSYHDFYCSRTPNLGFGTFDRDAALLSLLKDNAPIGYYEFIELVHSEYGYDQATVMGSYLQNLTEYYHNGIYIVEQKRMAFANQATLKAALKEDFYYFDEIREIYREMFPDADSEDINPFNLKMMGFVVLCRYAVQNYNSLEAYFRDILTKEDVQNITAYRKRFVYVQTFSQVWGALKRNLEIIEFEPNQIIHIRKLERSGITKEMLQEFCDQVYDYVEEKLYFSAQSLKQSGFVSELYDLGFSDWFYASILASDERFSSTNMFGNIVLYKGQELITCRSFETDRIREHGSIDVYDLMSEMTNKYGCKIKDKSDVLYKIQGTEIYYDKILDRLYANAEMYYQELENMEGV